MSDLEREVRKLRKTIEDIERKREFREMEREHNRRWHTIESVERERQYPSTYYDPDPEEIKRAAKRKDTINEINNKFGRDIEAKKHYLNEQYESFFNEQLRSSAAFHTPGDSRRNPNYAVITNDYDQIITDNKSFNRKRFKIFTVLSILFFTRYTIIFFIICFILSIVFLRKSLESPEKIRQRVYTNVVSSPDYKSFEKEALYGAKFRTKHRWGTREEYINSMIIESENALDSMEKK